MKAIEEFRNVGQSHDGIRPIQILLMWQNGG